MESRDAFDSLMYQLHSCKVLERRNGKVFVKSITGNHEFWLNEEGDREWEVIK
jgi:hypothetical protein